jgi:hypothetical protein
LIPDALPQSARDTRSTPVGDGGVGGDAKAEMHVLFRQKDIHAHGAQRIDEIAYRLNDDGCQPFARLVEQNHFRLPII